MKIRFIINPIAGTGKQKEIEKLIEKDISFSYDVFYTRKAGDATLLAKEAAIDEKIDVVIAVGGDGTVNECAKTLVNSNTALGVIPSGSGNGFAFHIGMKKKIADAIIQLNNCTISTIDSCTANENVFVNVSGIGFDAHISNLFSNLKKRGLFNYIKLITKEVFAYESTKYKLQFEGKVMETKAYLIAFANASQYGNDFRISPNAKLNDGLIDFVIVKKFAKWKIPLFLLQIISGKIHLSKYVEIIKTKEMRIKTTNSLVHLDGEPITLSKTITLKNHRESLKIFAPNEKE
ncbi:MAG: hypothetical protein CBC83_01210 [Flavobacteriales bacterium TMED123]|nr:MAG: hypothetical protein CBC83_01210 [Flavobacteriales bacterium TMED123]